MPPQTISPSFLAGRAAGLQHQISQIDQKRAGLRRERLAPGMLPRSPFTGEQGYLQDKRNRAELADIEAQFTGKPVQVREGTTAMAIPGLRQTRPGAGSMSLGTDPDEYDPSLKAIMRGNLIERMAAENDILDQQRRGGRLALESAISGYTDELMRPTPPSADADLFGGMTAARQRAIGDIARREDTEDARQGARTYMDPVVREGRQAQISDQDTLLRSRYGHEIDAQAKIEAARIAAAAREGSARTTAGGALTREALRGLLKSRELRGLLGGPDSPDQDAAIDTLLNRYAGGGPGVEGAEPIGTQVDDISFQALMAGAMESDSGKQQLAEWWPQLSPQQQALVRQRLAGGGGAPAMPPMSMRRPTSAPGMRSVDQR